MNRLFALFWFQVSCSEFPPFVRNPLFLTLLNHLTHCSVSKGCVFKGEMTKASNTLINPPSRVESSPTACPSAYLSAFPSACLPPWLTRAPGGI